MTIERMGASPRRHEDARFVTGQGAYLDDLKFDRLTHAVVLRSPHAHALIRSIDVTVARRAPGVITVLTAPDAATDGLKPLRPYAEAAAFPTITNAILDALAPLGVEGFEGPANPAHIWQAMERAR